MNLLQTFHYVQGLPPMFLNSALDTTFYLSDVIFRQLHFKFPIAFHVQST